MENSHAKLILGLKRLARLAEQRRLVLVLLLGLLPVSGTAQISTLQGMERNAVGEVLNQFHAAAARGDFETYFSLMHENGFFIGTDASERWSKAEFQAYAGGRSGWVYRATSRDINFTPDGNSAWFHEILASESYGSARGTGVLISTPEGWKIVQYHLTFPVPNSLAREVTDMIKEVEGR